MKLLTNPNKFFDDLKYKSVQLRYPLIIVALLATLTSLYQYLLITKMSQAFPEDIAKFFVVGAYVGMIGSFIGMFAVWFVIALLMHAISALFGGEGSFRRTFEFTGYGFLPSLIGSAITVPFSAYYVMSAEVPKISVSDIQTNPELLGEVLMGVIPRELVYSNVVISLAVTVWSLVIWSFAIKHAREIEFRKAFITALIPTTLFGIYQVWSILKLL
ncbi:Protein of unknown function DUF2143 [Ferroglobus placidus DSM 10642]|uniref:Yip1 domain-containing protein n=1 Tax=Ferroglobus placidus (strain DSM 10642 / AEDII12DO) TaxID=589924 RepID=D3S1S6_FERPA|nr:Yip1 family protein [Ferroglobus placidus]ADC64383.1 Protein of unknown function DUF2143 [Ferroglobus placidus DSM 10642]